MGLNFRKRVTLLPGLTLNFGKRGTSVTVGKRGASMNFSRRGTTVNMGVPGTGISYRQTISKPKTNSQTSRSTTKLYTSTSKHSNTPLYSPENMSEQKASITMWILLVVLLGGAAICFYKCFTSDFSSPFAIMFAYTLASLFLAFGGLSLGFTINAHRGKGSNLPLNLGLSGLVISAVSFLIWCNFWPSYAHSYRTYYGHKIPEIVNLDGWVTFGQVVSWIALIIAGIIFLISLANKNEQRND